MSLLSWTGLLALCSTEAWACPSPQGTLEQAYIAIEEVRLEDAMSQLGQLEEDLLCLPDAVDSVTLAGLIQLRAATQFYLGDEASTLKDLRLLLELAPRMEVDEFLGEDLATLFAAERLGAESAAAYVSVELGAEAWLDGRPMVPAEVHLFHPGRHFLQRQSEQGLSNEWIALQPGERWVLSSEGLRLETPPAEPAL